MGSTPDRDFLQVAVRTGPTTTPDGGGTCTAGAGCGHFFTEIRLTEDQWTEFTVAFTDLAQPPAAQPATFDPSTLLGVEFRVDPVAAMDFDVWIDDLSFY